MDDTKPAPMFVNTIKFDPDMTPARAIKVLEQSNVASRPQDPLLMSSDPVQFLLNLMDTEPDPDFSPEQRLFHDSLRLKAATAAAPFVRPKLAQIEHKGGITLTHEAALSELE